MKILILLAVLVVCTQAYKVTKAYADFEFNEFMLKYRKVYDGSAELAARRAIFEQNLNRIVTHNMEANAGLHSFRVDINKFADMTNEEFTRQMNGYRASPVRRNNRPVYQNDDVSALPDTVDWRTKGLVTDIKDQGQCGSCWAFSAVAGIEGQHALSTKKLVSLSEQNLVDCSTPEGNQGCNGGLMDQAFEYVIKNGGIDTETSYPYEAKDDKCAYNKKNSGATIKNFTDVATGSETSLQSASATIGPISVAIDASSILFQFYSSGVYSDPFCGNEMANLDHGVTVVGYGTQSGKDYWLVKNSWGTVWGQKGYIMMARNKDNQCGIATAASYPTGVH